MNVDEYIETQVPPQYHDLAQALRTFMHECAPDAREAYAYKMPVWVGRRIVAYMNGSSKGIALSFVHGTALRDGAGLLKGAGKSARFVRLRNVAELTAHEAALRSFVAQALEIDARVT